MSFSTDVKEELLKVVPHEGHCRLAELSALIKYYGEVIYRPELEIRLSMDNQIALSKCKVLLSKEFNIDSSIFVDSIDKPKSYMILNKTNANIVEIVKKLSLQDPMSLIKRDCCKRAYLRGAFIASGFIGDPSGNYHFEIVTEALDYARLLAFLLRGFGVEAKQSVRKNRYVSYLKDVESILDVLNVLNAPKAMMELMNARIVKDVRNDINRRNNCDMANISKAVNAASKQIEDIMLIHNTVGLGSLPGSLSEIAKLRIEHPESSLTELGTYLDPPVGKSGVNHRLRKISEYATNLRNERE